MLLRENKLLRKYLGLGWLSCIGDALYYIALMTYAATLENPTLGILIITISTTFPTIINIILGVLADGTKDKVLRIIQSGIFRGIVFIIIAFIINLTRSLTGIIVIGILNGISDIVGNYSASVKSPFLRLLAKDDQLEQVIGLNSGIREILDVIAGFIGVALLGFLGIYYLAFFNAGIFFLVSFGFKTIRKNLTEVQSKINPPEIKGASAMVGHIKKSLVSLIRMKPLRNFLLIAAAMNSILATAMVTLLMSLTANPEAQIINFEFTVSVAKGIAFVFGLAAALLGPKYFKNIGITFVLVIEMLAAIGFMIGIGMNMPWLAVGFISIGVFFGSMFSIRLSTFVQQAIPLETLGTVGEGMNLFLSVLPIPITIFFSSIAAVSLQSYAVIGIIVAFIVLVIAMLMKLDKIDLKSSMAEYGSQS